jgi:hypothetical protein
LTRIKNQKFCNQLSNLNAGFTNLDGETLVKVIKPPIVHIDISGIMLDLDHVKGLLKVCHSTLLTVHCGINNWGYKSGIFNLTCLKWLQN